MADNHWVWYFRGADRCAKVGRSVDVGWQRRVEMPLQKRSQLRLVGTPTRQLWQRVEREEVHPGGLLVEPGHRSRVVQPLHQEEHLVDVERGRRMRVAAEAVVHRGQPLDPGLEAG